MVHQNLLNSIWLENMNITRRSSILRTGVRSDNSWLEHFFLKRRKTNCSRLETNLNVTGGEGGIRKVRKVGEKSRDEMRRKGGKKKRGWAREERSHLVCGRGVLSVGEGEECRVQEWWGWILDLNQYWC